MKDKLSLRIIVGLVLLCALILLNGCSSMSRKDGPPPFPVDETKIPDAVPKKEALSKYGNYKSYVVFGKRYYTLKSPYHYEEQGTASWYGTKFHKLKTSSGERYDMLAMTAAHKTLPLPTYVQVTNLANGKHVIVKVNDRGPFEGNRLIDLSYVAAKKLGMIGHGTAHVDVKAINPDEYDRQRNQSIYLAQKTNSYQPTHKDSGSNVYLQVGVFKNRLYAERLKNRLSKELSSPIRITRFASKTQHLYHVQIGPLRNTSAANQISRHLKSIGVMSARKVISNTEV